MTATTLVSTPTSIMSPDHQAQRRGKMTSTRIADLACASINEGYRTAFELWMQLTGREPEFEGNADTRRGTYLEAGTARWWADVAEHDLEKPPSFLLDPKYDGKIGSSFDYFAIHPNLGARSILEIKNPREPWRDYGDAGTDQVRRRDLYQVCIEQGVARANKQVDADFAYVVVGGWRMEDPRGYVLPWDEELYETLCDMALRFLKDHVESDKPPTLDGSPGCTEYVATRYPTVRNTIVRASTEVDRRAREAMTLQQSIDHNVERLTTILNEIKSACGDNGRIEGEGWHATYGTRKGATKWKDVATELGATPELIARHKGEDGRTFRPSWT